MLSEQPSRASRSRSFSKNSKSATSASSRSSSQGQNRLVFEWPDLPAIDLIKGAVARNKVCMGIQYSLPPDRHKISIEQRYRTDLRTLFQNQYSKKAPLITDDRLHKIVKEPFGSVYERKWATRCPRSEQIRLSINAESEKYRQIYTHSAPASSNLNSGEPLKGGKLKRRSTFSVMAKSSLPPEAIRMRKEAEKILQSVQDEEGDFVGEKADDTTGRKTAREGQREVDRKRVEERLKERVRQSNKPIEAEKYPTFDTYDDIKDIKAPKTLVPMRLRTEFLSHQKSQDIWRWLHVGDEMSDFDYFLSICS